jgi:DNA-binding transcriptional regulator YhcF (GntR family)
MNQKNLSKLKDQNYFRGFNQIIDNKDLSLEEKIMLQIILSFEMNGQKCFLSYNQWCEKLSCSIKTFKRLLAKVKEKGLVEWKTGGGHNANIYEVSDVVYEKLFAHNAESVEIQIHDESLS